MNNMKISKTKEVKELLVKTFPEYRGRKFYLNAFSGPKELRSFWDEGSRTYYKFINLSTFQVHEVHSNHPFFEANQPSTLKELPVGVALVSYSIFMGKETGV